MYLSHRKKKQTAIQSLSDADEADRSTETQEGVLVHVSDQKGNQYVATMQEEWAGIYKPYNEALGENQSSTSSFNIQRSGNMEQNKTKQWQRFKKQKVCLVFLSQAKVKGKSFSMVKSTTWLQEAWQIYVNQWKATLRQSIHPSGKVANLSEMSIAWIFEFGSGSMLSAEKGGHCVRLTH